VFEQTGWSISREGKIGIYKKLKAEKSEEF